MSDRSLRLSFFGSFRLEIDGSEVANAPRPVQEVLAHLVIAGSGGIEREVIAAYVWPDSDSERGRFYLRRCLTQIRNLFGTAKGALKSIDDRRIWLDDQYFSSDLIELRSHLNSASESDLDTALSLYQGPLLMGNRSDRIKLVRLKLRDQIVEFISERATLAESLKEYGKARNWLERCSLEDPTKESIARQLMRVIAAQGDYAGVVRILRGLRHRLRSQLNLPPSRETTQLYRELMSAARLLASSKVDEQPTTFQSATLPREVTPFTGRIAEASELKSAVSRFRMVTLTGVGGVGKSRLAIKIASDERSDFYRVVYVDISICANPNEIGDQVAKAFQITEISSGSLSQMVGLQLGGQRCFLVLDGIDRFTRECEALLQDLLGLENLHILCTTRKILYMPEEHVVSLAPLKLALNSEDSEAVSYFLERALHVSPQFRMNDSNRADVVEICRRLDGLPLALDLAAARLRSMPPDEILACLDNRFEFLERNLTGSGHRSLQAALDLSFQLLTEDEAILLPRLSTFPATFSAHAAQSICSGDGLAAGKIPVLLGNLVDQSLLEYSPQLIDGRYRLLETVKSYAGLRLLDSGSNPEEYLDRHSEHYLRISASFESDPACTERFLLNEPNFGHAIQRLSESESTERKIMAIKLVNRLFPYWIHSGRLFTGLSVALRVIETSDIGPNDDLAECLIRTGGAAHVLFNLPLAEQIFSRAGTMADQLGLDHWGAEAVFSQGEVAANRGRLEEATKLLIDGLERFRALNDEAGQAQVLGTLGYVARLEMNLDKARDLTEEAMSIYVRADHQAGRLWCAGSLAAVHISANRPDLAIPLFLETLSHQEREENKLAQAWNLTNLGVCYRMLGDLELAEQHLRRAMALRDIGEHDLATAWQLVELGQVLRLRGLLHEAREVVTKGLELCRASGSANLEAKALLNLAWINSERKDRVSAKAYRSLIQEMRAKHQISELEDELEEFDRSWAITSD